MEFHRVGMNRMAGAAARAMLLHREAVVTNQSIMPARPPVALGLAAHFVEILAHSDSYGLRTSPGGSAQPKAMKSHENSPDRL